MIGEKTISEDINFREYQMDIQNMYPGANMPNNQDDDNPAKTKYYEEASTMKDCEAQAKTKEYEASDITRKICLVLLAFVGTILSLALLFAAYLMIWPVQQKVDELTLELGDELTEDAAEYLKGTKFSLGFAEVDTAGVNHKELGVYTAFCTHGMKEFTYRIVVVDTTPPEMALKKEKITLEKGKKYAPDQLIEKAEDLSGTVTYKAVSKAGQKEQDYVLCDEMGETTVEIWAMDLSGNVAKESVLVTVDTAPEIQGVGDCYVLVGTEHDLTKNVEVQDEVDGDLTSQLSIDTGELDLEKEGVYDVVYSATDQYGLETEETGHVHVLSQDALSDLIATRAINRKDHCIEGAINLYCAGAGEMASLQEQEEYMLPSLVHIFIDRENGWSKGSGFIIDIRDDYVYICSNEHVLSSKGQSYHIYFFDGTSAPYEVIDTNADEDIGFAKVKISDIPEETFECLQSTQIDLGRYEEATRGGVPIFMEILDKDGLDYVKEGESVGLSDEFYVVNSDTLRITIKLVGGNSGSAILDQYGNVIAMAVGSYWETGLGTHYFGVTVDHILELYESMTGNDLYTR